MSSEIRFSQFFDPSGNLLPDPIKQITQTQVDELNILKTSDGEDLLGSALSRALDDVDVSSYHAGFLPITQRATGGPFLFRRSLLKNDGRRIEVAQTGVEDGMNRLFPVWGL